MIYQSGLISTDSVLEIAINRISTCVENEPWVFYRGAEYYLASQAFPWEFVLFACKMMGADLLSVHSKEELAFIKERMMKVSKHIQNTLGRLLQAGAVMAVEGQNKK